MADTIRETLLEARAALRRRADDENTPMREGRILREAALLADMHAAALDVRGSGGTAACALQGIAGSLVRSISGSVTNVIGLPVAEVIAALREVGGPLPRFVAGTPS